jgi:hypothetical protein
VTGAEEEDGGGCMAGLGAAMFVVLAMLVALVAVAVVGAVVLGG